MLNIVVIIEENLSFAIFLKSSNNLYMAFIVKCIFSQKTLMKSMMFMLFV